MAQLKRFDIEYWRDDLAGGCVESIFIYGTDISNALTYALLRHPSTFSIRESEIDFQESLPERIHSLERLLSSPGVQSLVRHQLKDPTLSGEEWADFAHLHATVQRLSQHKKKEELL